MGIEPGARRHRRHDGLLPRGEPALGALAGGRIRGVLASALALASLAACAPAGDAPGAARAGSASAPLALSPDGRTLWVVNPDADSVTPVDTASLTAGAPLPVGGEPWSVVVTPRGEVLVVNRRDGSVTILDGARRTDVPVGAEPAGIALAPSGRLAYVAVSADGVLAEVDVAAGTVLERIAVGPAPWAVAVTDDGDADDHDETIVVTHRLARLRPGGREAEDAGKEGRITLLTAGAQRDVALPPYAFGYPNALEGLALHGFTAYVAHLLNAPEPPRDFETTVSGALTAVQLDVGAAGLAEGLHLNDDDFSTPTNFPRAVALAPDGWTAYVVLAGTDAVMGIALSTPGAPELIGFWPTGANPRGIVLDSAGRRAFVMNYLSRDVSVLDLEDAAARREIARVPVVGETLAPEVHRGKVLFNNAFDPRVSQLGWISCAMCHPDGGADGTTWLTPDGPRQSMPLWGAAATAPFHASATRDEVQDFEHDIEGLMAGSGLAPGLAAPELGAPNAGRSADLDALAAYVLHGVRVPASPSIPAAAGDAQRGRALFATTGCTTCHGGAAWTASAMPGEPGSLAPNGERSVTDVLRDVGTFDAARDVLGADGFDVPTLLGVGATAPYLHDGSAPSLEDVLALPSHAGSALAPEDAADLATFLRTIDAGTEPFE